MNQLLLKIELLSEEMGRAEKKAAHWILEHPEETLPLSIIELAEKADCSEATLVRFSRRLGFAGFQEFKIALARENQTAPVNAHMTAEDSAFEIYQKVCNDIYCSLERTQKSLNPDDLQQTAQAIMKAGQIVIFGLRYSAAVAVDASYKLLQANYNTVAYTDSHLQKMAAAHLNPGDVVIGISHSGASKEIMEAMQIAKERGAVIVCITGQPKSPIVKCSDFVLCTSSSEPQYNKLALNSRIAQLSIIDALYCYLVYQSK